MKSREQKNQVQNRQFQLDNQEVVKQQLKTAPIINLKKNDIISFQDMGDEEYLTVQVERRTGKTTGIHKNEF